MADQPYEYYLCKVPDDSLDEFLSVLYHGGGVEKVTTFPYQLGEIYLEDRNDLDSLLNRLSDRFPDLRVKPTRR